MGHVHGEPQVKATEGIFDYVIVGGGSAGCVLANRLSADPGVTVCLLEAGPADTNWAIHIPAGMLWLMRSKVLNWQFHTEPEPALARRRLFWPRGRTLGGSSSINAMCYTRGHPRDYDAWEAEGNRGWAFRDVLPYFKRSEDQARGPSAFHGVGGPLHVSDFEAPTALTQTFIEAGQQAGFPHCTDFNGADLEGVGLFQTTQKRGLRWSTAKGYLSPARARPNLKIVTNAHAQRVVFEGLRACGVVAQREGGIPSYFAARREVILSAGAVQSPQLLMLSGVGPGSHLAHHGLRPIVDLPGVGQNLQDHLDVMVVHQGKRARSTGLTPLTLLKGPWELARLALQGAGMLTSNGAEGNAFIKSSPEEPVPDLQLHFMPARLRDHGRDLRYLAGQGFSMHVCFLRPKSRGHISLASADPMAAPAIHANYLSHPEDLRKMILGIRQVRRIFAASAFDLDRGDELMPGKQAQSDAELEAFIRSHAETIYHPVGTCRMGPGDNPMSVVDHELRVHGTQGLRVVDASIMPTLVGGNTNAPTVMIAEKASDMLLRAVDRA